MFEAESIYHIYNCANGSENLFREGKNYNYFLQRYYEFINPIAETYAYCLLGNHFHMMVRVRSQEEVERNVGSKTFQKFETFGKLVSRQFGSLFSAYTQAFNKVYGRKGSLFQPNFKKKKVESDAYFTQLVLYIHGNPVKHGFVKDLYEWPHSSIHQISGGQPFKSSKLLECSKATVLDWFGGTEGFSQSLKLVKEMRRVLD